MSMEKPGFESTQEFFDLWLKTYESTYGRLLEMPALGPTREKSEKLEWFTRVSGLLFRVWDVLQEVVNNDELPENCEVRIRAFYVRTLSYSCSRMMQKPWRI